MMRKLSIILVIGFWLTVLNPNNAISIGVFDGAWIGPETISFGGYTETSDSFTIIYQESTNTLDLFDEILGKVEMTKSGTQWIITSPIVFNYEGINFVVSTFTLNFLNDSHLTGYMNFTADGIPGNSSIDAYKQNCQLLINGSTLTGLNGTLDSAKCYEINLPSSATDLDVQTMGGMGDCNLYIIYHRPINEWENYYSDNFGNDEQIFLQEPRDGKWYIILLGFEAYRGVSLKITYQAMEKKAMPWIPLLLLGD